MTVTIGRRELLAALGGVAAAWTNWPQTYRDKPRPDNLRSLHKFRKRHRLDIPAAVLASADEVIE
jgi:hypothetical protein